MNSQTILIDQNSIRTVFQHGGRMKPKDALKALSIYSK